MSDSKCENQMYVNFQLTQCLSRLIRIKSDHISMQEDCMVEYDFFMDNQNTYSEDVPSVFGDVASEDCMQRWIFGLQGGEPRSRALLCKALERADMSIETIKDEIYRRNNQEVFKLEDKIRTLKSIIAAKEEKLKEKAKKTEPKKKTSKAKKGTKS